MPEIRKHLAEDEDLKGLSAEKEAEIRLALSEHRNVQETGARYSNKGASVDYRGTLKCVCTEASDLSIPRHWHSYLTHKPTARQPLRTDRICVIHLCYPGSHQRYHSTCIY